MPALRRPALAALAAALIGCAAADTSGGSPTEPPVPTTPTAPATPATPNASAGYVTGTVVDAAGRPLAGVQVFADNTLFYNTNAVGVTDAQGRYRIDVRRPVGTWHMSAQLKRQYQGRTYQFDLHPDDDNAFPGADGAVRNFEWRLSGLTHDGGHYGAKADFYVDRSKTPDDQEIDAAAVELTFTPDGLLADGSTGRAVTARLGQLDDFPIGKYTVTARYAPPNGPGRPLVLKLRDGADYAASVSALWPAEPDGRVKLLEFMVRDR